MTVLLLVLFNFIRGIIYKEIDTRNFHYGDYELSEDEQRQFKENIDLMKIIKANRSIYEAYENIIKWEGKIVKVDTSKNYLPEYIQYMKKEFDVEAYGASYKLVDIDGDGTYELLYCTSTTAADMGILAYHNGKVIDNHLEMGLIKYQEGENKIYYDYGRMGYYGNCVGHLEDGDFVSDVRGEYSEVILNDVFDYKYSINEKNVTREEYNTYFDSILSTGDWGVLSSSDGSISLEELEAQIELMMMNVDSLAIEDYFKVYLHYVLDEFSDEDVAEYHYNLVDFDADGVYELKVSNFSDMVTHILSYYNGKMKDNIVEGAVYYIAEDNKFYTHNFNGMACYEETLYHWEKGALITDKENRSRI